MFNYIGFIGLPGDIGPAGNEIYGPQGLKGIEIKFLFYWWNSYEKHS